MTDIAISVKNVSKCYRTFDDPRSRLMHAVWPRHTRGMQEVWALKEINFEIKRGEAVAIIGRNGGGKSTLLEILTGTLQPTTGEVTVNGRVSALLELGSGFNPEYSGRDNVILNGLLLGLTKEDILSRFGEIEAFAEIGAAIDRPVKTYSSGMMMRLAFAVQVLCDPDILIIDEALSVGDFFFQQKCLSYIRKLCAKGVTLLFVSHDMGTVRDICKRAIFLKNGQIQCDGESTTIIHQFLTAGNNVQTEQRPEAMRENSREADSAVVSHAGLPTPPLWKANGAKEGAAIQAVWVLDRNGDSANTFVVGDEVRIAVAYHAGREVNPQISIAFINKFDQTVSVTGSYHIKSESGNSHENNGVIIFQVEVQMNLEAGQYSLAVNIGKIVGTNQGYALDQTPNLGPITLTWDYSKEVAPFLGMFGLPITGKYLISESR